MKTFRHPITPAMLFGRMAVLLVVLFAGTFTIQAQPCQAWFMYTTDTTTVPNTVGLYDSSFSGNTTITTYQWQYNGSPVGTNTAFQTISVNTIQTGDVICLTITTDSGCTSTYCDSVILPGPPCFGQAGYSYTHDSIGNYFFAATSSGFTLPISYQWQASNGGSGTASTFSTQFVNVGFYSVCLTISDANGCTSTYCDSIGAFNSQPCLGCSPHIFYIQDSINPHMYTFFDTTTFNSTPTTDIWRLNNVNSGSGSSFTVTLPAPGTSYNICHNVVVPGCSASCSHNACVTIVTSQLPGVHINYFDGDSSAFYCTAPQSVNLYIYGMLTGYPVADSTLGIHINFDDGTDTSFLAPFNQTYFYLNVTHAYQNAGTYTPQLIVLSPDSLYSDTAIFGTPITITNTCGSVTGYAYLDNNQNCVFDSGDVVLANRGVSLSNSTGIYRYTYTDANGLYSFNVPTGMTYSITINTSSNYYSGHYAVICPAGGTLSVSTVPSSNNNFYLACPTGFDLSAYVSGWGFVPGHTGSICIYPHDYRCGSPNGQVIMILDPLLTAIPDSGGHYTIQGDSVIWNITNSGSGNYYYQSLCVPVSISTSATIGDSVCVTVIILPIAGDSVPANNTIVKCWGVRSSWDPNDKIADPAGAGPNHAIRPGTELTYTIDFQNTGTATAQDIFILDQLDANLDVNTLEVLATSHPMVPSVQSGNVLRFTYNNINLVDSNANEQLSHGYVMYSISPISTVANGAVINNTAGIYFDFNPAVMTNTTWHTIDYTLAVHQVAERMNGVSVYPNPASSILFVKIEKPGMTEINLFDVTGRMVLHQKISESGSIDVKSLSAGSYKIQILREEGVQNSSLIIAR